MTEITKEEIIEFIRNMREHLPPEEFDKMIDAFRRKDDLKK